MREKAILYNQEQPANGVMEKRQFLTLNEWLERDIEPPDYLLGELYSTTTRAMLVGPTGIGKTNFGLAKAFGMASGSGFLHFDSRRPAKVLYIDGELSRLWLKQLLKDAVRRLGADEGKVRENLYILSREDAENMPPLNTEKGQKYIDEIIDEIGTLDFIFFDNIQALITGNMKDEESWAETLLWIKGLTRRRIGQAWLHHTGIDKSRGYGTSTKEWQLDTVMLMEKIEDDRKDIAFNLSFPKARMRTPDNRQYFEKGAISLEGDQWTGSAAANQGKQPSPVGKEFHDALLNALCSPEAVGMQEIDGRPTAVTVDQWKAQLVTEGLLEPPEQDDKVAKNRYRAMFSKYKNELLAAKWIAIQIPYVWSAKKTVAE